MWSLLIATLPSQPNAVRLRVWRALKALGCAALRDGAYLLPQAQAAALDALADEVRQHGGSASVLTLVARTEAQQQELLALFDRSAAYADWRATALALARDLPVLAEPDARRRLRAVADALAAVRRIDYLPGAAGEQAADDLAGLRRELDRHYSRGEPQAGPATTIARLDAGQFQRQRWATRARPRVDRLACAWLIRRFVDPEAQFVWLADTAQVSPNLIGFDFDGARFSHVGARVSFEVIAASFGLDADPRLQRLGAVVRCADAGGIPVAEAAGLDAVLAGLRALHADDDTLVAAAGTVFDALYAAPEIA